MNAGGISDKSTIDDAYDFAVGLARAVGLYPRYEYRIDEKTHHKITRMMKPRFVEGGVVWESRGGEGWKPMETIK